MDGTLKGVVGLLGGTDVEARCAALLVLTHLNAADPPVVEAVARSLASPNVVIRDFALGYFEAVHPREGLSDLLPLLDADDETVRHRVVGILAQYGPAGVTPVKKLVTDAPRRRINAVIDLCARVRSRAALDILFGFMSSEDLDAERAACEAVIARLPTVDSRVRADLFARAVALATGAKGRRSALVAAARVLGAAGDAKARKLLFAMLDTREPHIVRTHAVASLVHCLRGQRLTAAEIDRLLPLLREDDEAGIVRPAVRLLEDQPIERRYLPLLNRLAESPQPLVKRFAVQKLGAFESTAVVKTLIGYLTDDSYARRDQATTSLKTLPAARSALMQELLACDDERKAWTLANILLTHDRKWKRETLVRLWKRLETALEQRDDRLYSAYVHFLTALDGGWLAGRIRARAERLRKGKRFADSARCLALLKDSEAWDDETRFAFAVASVKSHQHALTAAGRRHDLPLDTLLLLSDSPFPLIERLRRERTFAPEDLYFIAFNLAEARGEARAVARELLAHLAGKHGRTKVGKAARNKLKLVEG